MPSGGERARTARYFVERGYHVVLVCAWRRQIFLFLLDYVREGHALVATKLEDALALRVVEGCLVVVGAGTGALILLDSLDSIFLVICFVLFALGPHPGAAR